MWRILCKFLPKPYKPAELTDYKEKVIPTMAYNPLHYPYPSRRTTVYARQGMVATSQYLAAQAGLDILKKGGNAVDAAVATAACLTVVEPTSNGIGGDAFALVWAEGKLHGLNASGPAPKAINLSNLRKQGIKKMPTYGWLPVTVPGAPAAWAALSERFGKLPLTTVLKPAVEYARHGFPISPDLGRRWGGAHELYKEHLQGEAFKGWFDTFASWGKPPAIGEIWSSPGHAETLQAIGETRGEAFYRGAIAAEIDKFSRETGGYLQKEDLEAFSPSWVQPLTINYRGYDVWELPPNGQGLVALMALNILNGFEVHDNDIQTYHRQMEAVKLAFADGGAYIADPLYMKTKVADLLSPAYAAKRRQLIGKMAISPGAGKPTAGGTVFLATADGQGGMVSMIQSNYMGFGSGLVVPGTGIALQNRGCNFSFNPKDVNCLAPGKRTYHTIIPGFLTRGGTPVGPFGVMGGFMQPQGHVQVLMNLIDYKLNPQAALDAPRWRWLEGKTIEIEDSFPLYAAQELAKMGHDIALSSGTGGFGLGQVIMKNEAGVLAGGTDPRTDGVVAAW